MEHYISTLVENKPGVLQKVTSLVSRRGYNIESITVGECEYPELARMVFVVKGDEKVLEQVTKQLNKLVEVVKIKDLDPNNSVRRELSLIKVKTENETIRSEVMQYVNIFRGKILDVSDSSVTVEMTGDSNKINSFISLVETFGIIKIVRTGPTAVERG